MGVDFAVDAGENLKTIGGFRLEVAENNLRDLAEENARLTESTLVATYDDRCVIKIDKDTGEKIIPLCTDRASELRDAVIETVHVRYTGANGPITVYGTEKVVPADEKTRNALLSAFNDQIDELAPDLRYFAFFVEGYSEADILEYRLPTAGVCECSSGECQDADWPKQVGGTWNTVPANPYYCWPARKEEGAWRFDTGSSWD